MQWETRMVPESWENNLFGEHAAASASQLGFSQPGGHPLAFGIDVLVVSCPICTK